MMDEEMTIDDMRMYISGIKPTLTFKVWSYPDNKVYALYKKFKNEETQKYIKEVLNDNNR